MFAFEIVRDYNAVLPLMLVSVIADAIAMHYLPNSIMTEKLARRGLNTHQEYEINALKQLMDFYLVASVTTRSPRSGESEGNPYHFVSQQEFEQLVARNELLEYANVHGNLYGQPLKPIRDNLRAGRDVLLKIDVQGAATVRKKVSGAIFIFLVPESVEELAHRLTQRQTETEQPIRAR